MPRYIHPGNVMLADVLEGEALLWNFSHSRDFTVSTSSTTASSAPPATRGAAGSSEVNAGIPTDGIEGVGISSERMTEGAALWLFSDDSDETQCCGRHGYIDPNVRILYTLLWKRSVLFDVFRDLRVHIYSFMALFSRFSFTICTLCDFILKSL